MGNLSTYSYSIDVSTKIIITSKNLMNSSNLTVISQEEGTVNLTSHALSQIQRLSETSEDYGTTSTTNELYIFNGTTYTRANNKWSKIKDDSVENLVNTRNVIENESYFLNDSNIKLLGFKELDGNDCYWIAVEPSPKILSYILSKLMPDLLGTDIDLERLLSTSTLEWNSWITKDTYYLKKNDIKIDLSASAEDLGFPAENIGKVRINSRITSLYDDYNSPIFENLSKDFKIAYPFPLKNNDITIFGVIQEDKTENGYSYGDSYENKKVYIDAATMRYEKASLVDIDDRYYDSDRPKGNSDRRFFIFDLPNNTAIKKVRFEPDSSYGSGGSPIAFDLRLDQLGSIAINPIRKADFNASNNEISVEIYSLNQEDNYYQSADSLLVDFIIDLKVTNDGTDELLLNRDDFSLIDQFGWEYPAEDDYGSSLGTLLPGESRRFDLVIPEISILSDPINLKYKNLIIYMA
jgi:hypothetical protein